MALTECSTGEQRQGIKLTPIDVAFDLVYTGITIFYQIKVNMHDDIAQQPAALRAVTSYYQSGEGAARLAAAPIGRAPILTGMGASYHAALAIVPYQSGSAR